MKRRMLLIAALMFALMLTLSTGAQAAAPTPIDLDTLKADKPISGNGTYLITGSTEEGTITVTDGKPTIILQNARIISDDNSPISILDGADVTLQLVGRSSLTASKKDVPALEVKNGSKLTVVTKDKKRVGMLSAYQHQSEASDVSSGVIGGASYGTMTFKSGEVRVQLLSETAHKMSCIGGGRDLDAGYTINFNGANVIAECMDTGNNDDGYYAANIGSGPGATTDINITSGKVATNVYDGMWRRGAGIGSGYDGHANINITGGTIDAESEYGAAVGSGEFGTAKVNITGGIFSYAKSKSGAGIGSGSGSSAYADVNIKNGTFLNVSSIRGASIGAGEDGAADVTISGGSYDALYAIDYYSDGEREDETYIEGVIGSMDPETDTSVTIAGTKIKARSPNSIIAKNVVLNKALLPLLDDLHCKTLTISGKNTIQKVTNDISHTWNAIKLDTLNAGANDYIVLEDQYGEFKPNKCIAAYGFNGQQLRKGASFAHASLDLHYGTDSVTTIANAAEAMLLVNNKLRGVHSLDNAVNIINNDPNITSKTKPSKVVIKLLRDATIRETINKPCTIDGRGRFSILLTDDQTLHVRSNLALSLLTLGDSQDDKILLEAPGITLATKLVIMYGSITDMNHQPSATLHVNSRLDVDSVKVHTLKLNKAFISLGEGIIDIQNPIALVGANTLFWDINIDESPILKTNHKTLTSGSGTLKLDAYDWYESKRVGYVLATNSGTPLASLGRAKLPTYWSRYKAVFGDNDTTLGYKAGAVSLIKGKKITPYASIDEALNNIQDTSAYVLKLNEHALMSMTNLPPSLTIDGQGYDLRITGTDPIRAKSLTIKNLDVYEDFEIECEQLSIINSRLGDMRAVADRVSISGDVSVCALSVKKEMRLNNKTEMVLLDTIENTAPTDGELKLILNGNSMITHYSFDDQDALITAVLPKAALRLVGSGKLTLANGRGNMPFVNILKGCTIKSMSAVQKQFKLGAGFEDYSIQPDANDYLARLNYHRN
ncbi:carbohydrate-binding domain-containing protein [Eubacteriales bacterium OttesenSCG-928-N13]|nr:carbohydrate-binding domain-containing protein [Eubacteriales bacterium OttesenSCG-928-N13]